MRSECDLQQSVDNAQDVKKEPNLVMAKLAPWFAGSGIALGQAVLATACTLPTAGKCAGCGSCVVGVAALYSWAVKRRKTDLAMAKEHGLEPFEIRSQASQGQDI